MFGIPFDNPEIDAFDRAYLTILCVADVLSSRRLSYVASKTHQEVEISREEKLKGERR